MTLKEVRTEFVKQTGRYDLATANYTDNGADFYIKAGQRMLDRMLDFPKNEAELKVSFATDAYEATLTNIRAVREVYVPISGTTDSFETIPYASLRELRIEYGQESSVVSGTPALWSLGYLRSATAPNTTTEGSGSKLVVMPPVDKTYTLTVKALLSSTQLSNDTSISFWSAEHPEVLVWAGMYKMEVGYRNREGARAVLEDITQAVQLVNYENVEQSIVDNDLLGDSWRFIRQSPQGFDREVNS